MKTQFDVGSKNKQTSDDSNTTQIQIGIRPFLPLIAMVAVLIYWLTR